MSLNPGTRLGPYEITAFLGAGGMGEVYRAKDTRLGRTVAVKVLPADFAADPERKRRFEQEARAVSALNHPNICALYDIGSAEIPGGGPTSYLVMEFLDGQSLAERLIKGPLTLREAIEVGAQVADALSKAHRSGIIHRDIKPGNVILTKEGAKLLDFGLAKARVPAEGEAGATLSIGSTPITQAGSVTGTVPYMAPEQLEGRETDARTDIFAFGAMLYEMLSGRRAFDGGSQASIIAAIMTSDPPSLVERQPVTPPALDRLVRQCLAKDPDKRWQSAGDIARHLEGLLEEIRFPSSASRVAIPAASPRSRVRRLAILGAGALAFAALVAGAFLIGRRGADRPFPTFHRLTFRRGTIQSGAFTSDGQSVVYTARWDGGPLESYSVRTDGVDSILREGLRGYRIQAISSTNELAVMRGQTVATAPLAAGAPRAVFSGVSDANWLPDGSAMAVVRNRSTIECPPGKVIYRLRDMTLSLSGLTVSPKGEWIAVLEHALGHGCLLIIDRSGREKARSAFHDGLVPPVWTPNGREAWFTIDGEAVRAMDLNGRERSVLRSPRMQLQDIARDGRVLLLLRDQVVRMNVKTPSDNAERDISYYGWSLVEDISADGRTILFDEGGESNPQNTWAIFLRGVDGSPPQKLTNGYRSRISPDGKWVAAFIFPNNKDVGALALVPTGPGEPQRIPVDANQGIQIGGWLPDSSGFVFMTEAGGLKGWLAKADGSPPTPITPPGWWVGDPSPDGRYVIAENGLSEHPDGILYLYAIDGKTKIPLAIDPAQWGIYGWHDARRLRVGSNKEGGLLGPEGLRLPRRIYLLDIQTGKAEPWKEFGADLPRAGLANVARFHASADGKSYVYDYSTNLGTLYIAEGLR